MITIKLSIKISKNDEDLILKYQNQYSNCLHVYYNRYKEGMSQKDCKHLKLNNVELLDSWFRQSCIFEAMGLVKQFKDKALIFGGKKNFHSRSIKNISKDEFKYLKLTPLYSIGENNNKSVKCNRKFFVESTEKIIFKPNRKEHIVLNIKTSGKYKRYLELIKEHQDLRDLSVTYKLSDKFIWISFDESILKNEIKHFKQINNRIIAIDLNPNFIGYSIIDWMNSEKFNIIDKGVLSIKNINDKDIELNKLKTNSSDLRKHKLNNKRKFEIFECSKFLIEKMKHYKCSLFSLEKLNMKTEDLNKGDLNKGKLINKLCINNWCRNKLINNLKKWCNIYNVKIIEVNPEYSSFIGNLVFRYLKYPDMILSSFEISRRGYEFYHQYLKKDKDKNKNIIWIELTDKIKKLICQSLEELSINNLKWRSLFDLYCSLKKSKCKYRFPLEIQESFSQKLLKYNLVFS